MNNFQKGLFDKIQQKANINPDDVYKVADSVKHANFKDEKTVRKLVRHLSKLANKPISKEKEDKIVQSIVKNDVPMDMNSLNQLFKK
ncbi:MAG: stage VI sporulation protein F [Bacillota bacterium]|uniref:Stage VI sporulation protein F n=1 Tax=Virgibacillus salarius TaxID=447199 RepID=A0A941DRX7_9BACI|nr:MULTISPECIES: stage VI sporulation protein F [Bacillaceae]NAZ08258.1 stage VI sporulation protein F [Agaribacter marinus]MBR7795545.1 stage VI sporulation protein F [Virgibacillus salarius]MCC2249029.1 stage VI sporulation protein F [Virgibacillus sp. AGTR]MDY7043388.1 stage VI sporulation protein F [Virgibacillus sp. M23]QRZ17009.1 stage VI sporulation protein F [Virgibacillus sp. AGTR]